MKETAYTSVHPTEPPPPPRGAPGLKIFNFSDPVRWYILGAVIYAAGAIAVSVWILLGPSLNSTEKVLQLPDGAAVKQLYSGIALSLLLTPAAVIIRRMAYDLALLQPFAIASHTPMSLAHFDAATDPGILAAARVALYSRLSGFTQLFLLIAGAGLVPVGALLLTTGHYGGHADGVAVVGIPMSQATGPFAYMNPDTNEPYVIDSVNIQALQLDPFLQLVVSTAVGVLAQQIGHLGDVDSTLGPIATANLTYLEGVTYSGVVTYTWKSGCEYVNDTLVTITSEPYENESAGSQTVVDVTIDFPNGTVPPQPWFPSFNIFNVTDTNDAAQDVFSSHFVLGGVDNQTTNWKNVPLGTHREGRAWYTSVKCIPTFEWAVSNCTYTNGTMQSCTPAPGANVTVLDEVGLNALPVYFSRLPGIFTELDLRLGGLPVLSSALMFDSSSDRFHYRAAPLNDFDKLFGLFAQSIAAVTSAGYLGNVEVPTSGQPSKPVYLVRIYILAITLFFLILAPVLAILDISRKILRHQPLRRATFLTAANAVRGPWWDSLLWGSCTFSAAELQASPGITDTYVMFGADEHRPEHIGLAPGVKAVEKDSFYFGVTG